MSRTLKIAVFLVVLVPIQASAWNPIDSLSNLFLPLFLPIETRTVVVIKEKAAPQVLGTSTQSLSSPLIINAPGFSKQEISQMIASAISSINPVQNVTYVNGGG